MDKYLSFYGWHFSKKMAEWAAKNMYKTINGKREYIQPYPKERLDALLSSLNVRIQGGQEYDALYVANMCKADYLGSSVKGEADLVKFIDDTLNDPDGYEGMVFTRFYADCIGSGRPIIWEDMI